MELNAISDLMWPRPISFMAAWAMDGYNSCKSAPPPFKNHKLKEHTPEVLIAVLQI